LDLVAEADHQWIEATLADRQLVVRLDPRTGTNRAKVTVRGPHLGHHCSGAVHGHVDGVVELA
jgi:hypothetical protein